MTREHPEKRFGVIAVAKGFITDAQLIEAVTIQILDDTAGRPHRLTGTILFDLGHMRADQIDEVLRAMEVSTKDPLGRVA